MQTYIVQKGDTIFGISKQFGVSTEEIRRTNNLENDVLIVGQALKIPTTETTALYIVKPGDSLYSIANEYNTTADYLKEINNLKTNLLQVGQQIKLPVSSNTTEEQLTPTLFEVYTVQSGDNLYEIANMFDMTVLDLMVLNNLQTTSLQIGQQLKVKSNEILNASGEECYGEGYIAPKYQEYVVKQGDSLYTIAQKYNTTIENLLELNNLVNDNLSIGQNLKVGVIS